MLLLNLVILLLKKIFLKDIVPDVVVKEKNWEKNNLMKVVVLPLKLHAVAAQSKAETS